MTTVKDIQERVFAETGLKTSVKKGTGSMKGYLILTPIFQNGCYPNFPFEYVQSLKNALSNFNYEEKPLFCSTSNICVYQIEDNRTEFKKEKKPKSVEINKVRTWGSKYSQMRLDKKSASNAKRMKKGGTARYY